MKNVFVSSTFSDLQDHRASVREGIRQLGLVDISMESFGSRDQRPKDECLRIVRAESDLFVGIYAHRYGFIPEGDRISLIESEYESATLANLPRFVYIIDGDYPWRPADIEEGEPKRKLEEFKNRLLNRHICQKFTTGDRLTAKVVADLGRHIAMREVARVDTAMELSDIGFESAHEPVEETTDEWNKYRNGIYNKNRKVFLAHVITPTNKPKQKFDVFIYLVRHKSDDFSDIKLAEFFLGKYWGNRVFQADTQKGLIGITTAAYGTFLCTCKITFDDGETRLITRYIDFESHRHGG